ncbi:MAG: hypothetical protein LUH46_00050, partial [Alistipes sp.]|nr:hypothetical protein [Alistipes sp.]
KIIQPGRTAKFFNRRRRRVYLSDGLGGAEERENIFLFGKYLLTFLIVPALRLFAYTINRNYESASPFFPVGSVVVCRQYCGSACFPERGTGHS